MPSHRELGDDAVSGRRWGLQVDSILQSDDLPRREKMRLGIVPDGTGATLKDGQIHVGCSDLFERRIEVGEIVDSIRPTVVSGTGAGGYPASALLLLG
jgi:hypothetical protein